MIRLRAVRASLLVVAMMATGGAVVADQTACQQGFEAQERGASELAVELLTSCLEAGDLSTENAALFHYLRASAQADLGAYARAIADFDQSIRHAPSNAIAYQDRGVVHHLQGELDRAIADFDRAIDLDPTNAFAFDNRGIAYRDRGDLERAVADFGRAIDLDPFDAHAFHNRGVTYMDMGLMDLAIADFDQAIRLDPTQHLAYDNRGLALMEKGLLDRAIADFGQVIRLDPGDPYAHSNRGWALLDSGEPERAIADFDEAIRLDSSSDDAYNGRAYARAAAGDLEGALVDVEHALSLRPGDPFIMDTLGDIFCRQGRHDEALETWEDSLARSSEAVAAKQQKLAKEGFYPGAIDGTHSPGLREALESWAAAGCPGV